MQKINLRDLYPDVYKTDVFVDVAEEVLSAIRDQQQDDAAYERRKFRYKAHYSLNRGTALKMMPSTSRLPRGKSWSRSSCERKCTRR